MQCYIIILLAITLLQPSKAIVTTVKDVSCGKDHACALLTDDDKIKCWGSGSRKQLGYGGQTSTVKNALILRSPHADYISNTRYESICSGDYYTCAVSKTKKKIFCWGFIDGFIDRAEGKLVYTAQQNKVVTQISCGPNNACAIAGGTLYCWGRNDYGQLGNGQLEMSTYRNIVHLGYSVTQVSVSTHACALLENNKVKCWGDNREGQLGIGTQKVKQAVETQSIRYCWVTPKYDENNTVVDVKADKYYKTYQNISADECVKHVQNGDDFLMVWPHSLVNSPNFLSIEARGKCIICKSVRDATSVSYTNSPLLYNYLIESNSFFRATYSSNRWKPALVENLMHIKAVETGHSRTCVTSLVQNNVNCWGTHNVEIDIVAGTMALGFNYGCITNTQDGGMSKGPYCWGSGINSGTGTGSGSGSGSGILPGPGSLTPLDIGAFDRTVTKFAIGGGSVPFACAVLDDGTLKCWGRNDVFQLGLGLSNEKTIKPTKVNFEVCHPNNYFSNGECIMCPNGTKTRVLSYGTYNSVRRNPNDCIFPPTITSISPNYGSLSGFTQVKIIGKHFGSLVSERMLCVGGTRCIEFVDEPYKLNSLAASWKMSYISPNEINAISSHGDDVVTLEYFVDGLRSNFNVNYTYLIPKITLVIPPPKPGGTIVIEGKKFSPDAESRTKVFVKIYNKCDLECVGVRILSATKMQCEYNVQQKSGDNAMLFIRTNYGEGHRDSSIVKIEYAADKGELQGIPPLNQYVNEKDIYSYSVWLSLNATVEVLVNITSESHIQDEAGNYVIKQPHMRCNIQNSVLRFPPNSDLPQIVQVLTEENSIDEGGEDAIAYRCTLKHRVISSSPSYDRHPEKYLRLYVRNDDIAAVKLRAPGVDQNNSFRYELDFLGPMCIAEGSAATYGAVLSTKPKYDVNITPSITLDHSDSPIIFKFYPDSHIIKPENWQTTVVFTLTILEDDIDNAYEVDAINVKHYVTSADATYRDDVKSVLAVFRVTDNDKAGIIVPPSSQSMVVAADHSGTVIINGFASQPMYQVGLELDVGRHSELFSISPGNITILPLNFRKQYAFYINVSKFAPPSITYELSVNTATSDAKYKTISIPIFLFVPSSRVTEPKDISLVRVNDKILEVRWEEINDASGYEMFWSTERAMLNGSTPAYFASVNGTSYTIVSLTELHKKVIYIKIRTIFMQVRSDWSSTTLDWTLSGDCEMEHEYLNTTCDYPLGKINGCRRWTCEECPEGGYCSGEKQWTDVKAKFGYWRNNGELKEPSNFTKCLFPPACLGAPNYFFRGQFVNDTGYDPATRDQAEKCSHDYGYQQTCLGDGAPRCRLCSTCSKGYRRRLTDGMARCDTCPSKGFGVIILLAGFLIVVGLLFLLIRMHIASGGKRTKAEMYQIVIINYLQLSSLTAGMDVPWPEALGYIFGFQGVISTIGEHLLSPDCEADNMQAADLQYTKQLVYCLVPWMVGAFSWLFWQAVSKFHGRNFYYRGPDDRSPSLLDGCVATIVFLLYLLYPTVCRSSFALIMCLKVDGREFMVSDLQEACYEGRHLVYFILLTIPQIIMYVIGLPCLGYYLIRKHAIKNQLRHPIVQFRYGMIYSGYRRARWWWDVTIAFRKASVCLVTSWLVGAFEVHGTILILAMAILMNEWGKPYTETEDLHIGRGASLQRLDMTANGVSLITAWTGLFFIMYPHCEHRQFGCIFLLIVIVAINVVFFGWCVWLFGKEKFAERREKYTTIIRRLKDSFKERTLPRLSIFRKGADDVQIIPEGLKIRHTNPLIYRKSFVREKQFVNPIHTAIIDNALQGGSNISIKLKELEMTTNPLRKERIRRANTTRPYKKRNMSIIDRMNDENDVISTRLKKVFQGSKEIRRLRDMAKKKTVFEVDMGSSVLELKHGWYQVVKGGSEAYYFNVDGTIQKTRPEISDLAGGWNMAFDTENGTFYYYNENTGSTSYDRPYDDLKAIQFPIPSRSQAVDENSKIGIADSNTNGDSDTSDWKKAETDEGQVYYYNTVTEETKWTI